MASSLYFLLAVLSLAIIAFSSAQDIYENSADGSQEEKRNFDREFMHFGKRSNNGGFQLFRPLGVYDKRASEFDRNFMPFGKRFSVDYEPMMEKKHFNREFMHFGKRSPKVYSDGWPLVLVA
uniref:Uncharacterized protein n=1 Tax=Panagrolaimus sp. ES5 TaxID=591445 RepID=A0AC34FXA5_9BILA